MTTATPSFKLCAWGSVSRLLRITSTMDNTTNESNGDVEKNGQRALLAMPDANKNLQREREERTRIAICI